jgi:hypothetical protein
MLARRPWPLVEVHPWRKTGARSIRCDSMTSVLCRPAALRYARSQRRSMQFPVRHLDPFIGKRHNWINRPTSSGVEQTPSLRVRIPTRFRISASSSPVPESISILCRTLHRAKEGPVRLQLCDGNHTRGTNWAGAQVPPDASNGNLRGGASLGPLRGGGLEGCASGRRGDF